MPNHILTCPNCTAPLTLPSPFAKSVVCRHCNTTVLIDLASAYRAAFARWNAPETHGFGSWCTVGNTKWAMGGKLASDAMSDVYVVERARWPIRSFFSWPLVTRRVTKHRCRWVSSKPPRSSWISGSHGRSFVIDGAPAACVCTMHAHAIAPRNQRTAAQPPNEPTRRGGVQSKAVYVITRPE